MREGIIKAGASQPSTASFVREDTIAARLLNGIELKGQILIIRRDARIPDRQTLAAALAGSSASEFGDVMILSILVARVSIRE